MIFHLQKAIKAAGIIKPLLDSFVGAFQSHGQYCPCDDRLYMVLSPSTLARHGMDNQFVGGPVPSTDAGKIARQGLVGVGGPSPLDDGVNKHGGGDRQPGQQPQDVLRANSRSMSSLGRGALKAACGSIGAAKSCIWSQTTAPVKKGEEIIQDVGQYRCTWPGF